MARARTSPAAARPAFRGGAVRVRVPATSANLGPGFDALGLALDLHDDVMARVVDDGIAVDVAGEGADEVPRDESHLIVQAMLAGFDRLGGRPHGLELVAANHIPHGRGLGSSAAAIVAGILLARALVLGAEERLPDADVLALAADLEGHPDNVAACLLGGLTVAWTLDGRVDAIRLECAPSIRPVALIPSWQAPTAQARELMPAQIPHSDAAFNTARAALLLAALTSVPQVLLPATDDRLHQPYRAPLMPEAAGLVARLRAAGLPAALSGAGPAVLALARDPGEVQSVRRQAPHGWRVEALAVDHQGARVIDPVG